MKNNRAQLSRYFVGGHHQRCHLCPSILYSNRNLRLHLVHKHKCLYCGCSDIRDKEFHTCTQGGGGGGGTLLNYETGQYVQVQGSLEGTFRRFQRRHHVDPPLLSKFYRDIYEDLHEFITKLINDKINYPDGVKIRLVLDVLIHNVNNNMRATTYLSSNYKLFLDESDIRVSLFDMVVEQVRDLDLYQENGSNWTIVKIKVLNINVAVPKFARTGTYIPTPNCYRKKRGLLNIPTKNNKCFQFCIIAKYLGIKCKAREARRLRQYETFLKYNSDIIDFSCFTEDKGVTLAQIAKFEKLNNNFSVNVYHHNPATSWVYPVKLVKKEKEYHVDLMRVFRGDKSHFILIKNFSSFMRLKSDCITYQYCRICLNKFKNKEAKDKHSETCAKYIKTAIKFPTKKNRDYSKFLQYETPALFIVADFETFNRIEDDDSDDEEYEEDESKMVINSNLEACGYAYIVVSGGVAQYYNSFVGNKPEKLFLQEMLKIAALYKEKVSAYAKTIRMTSQDWLNHASATHCCICFGRLLHY